MNNLAKQQCKPSKKGIKPLSTSVTKALLDRLHDEWEIDNQCTSLNRCLNFQDFYETIAFVNAVAWIARQQNHYPKLKIDQAECYIEYTTPSAEGLTLNDFICAAKIDLILEQTLPIYPSPHTQHSNDKLSQNTGNTASEPPENETHTTENINQYEAIEQLTQVMTRPVMKMELEENNGVQAKSAPKGGENTEQQTLVMTRPVLKTDLEEITNPDPEDHHFTPTHSTETEHAEEATEISDNAINETITEKTLPYSEAPFERTIILRKPYDAQEPTSKEQDNQIQIPPEETAVLPELDPDEVPTAVYDPETDDIKLPPKLKTSHKSNKHDIDHDAGDITIPESTLKEMEKTLILPTAKQKTIPTYTQEVEQTVVLNIPKNQTTGKKMDNTPQQENNNTAVDPAIENDDTLVMHTNTYIPVRE